MKIGFRTSPQNTDWPSLDAAWAEAGRHDVFDSGWMNDHLGDPKLDRGGTSFESITTVAALAHHVPGKRIGQTVLSATFRHPAVLARQALTLDHVTGGRYVIGLGAGWHVGEHEAYGIELPPLRERFDRFESTIRVLKALFSDEAFAEPGVTLDAPPYRLQRATTEPAPIHPGGPPLWLGGQGPRGLRLAARYADGWNYSANEDGTVSEFTERRDIVLRECEALGRDPRELTMSVQLSVGEGKEAARDAVETAATYVRAGSAEMLLTTKAAGGAAAIRRLAKEVAEPLRDLFG